MTKKGPPKHLVIATRGSQLALWQANFVANKLQSLGFSTELSIIKTTGDRVQDRFLHEIGGKGLFVKELEEALRSGEADVAMHSLKDMPARLDPEFSLAAILPRHSPNDALVVAEQHRDILTLGDKDLQEWLKCTPLKIATSSLRRNSILKNINREIEIIPIRGNVDTRLRKLRENTGWDGLILAEASLDRLSLKSEWPTISLDPSWFLPSPSQGALAIESKADHPALPTITSLGCAETTLMVSIERGVLSALGGDCTMPFAAFARKINNQLHMDAQVYGKTARSVAAIQLPFSLDANLVEATVSQILDLLRADKLENVMKELGLPMPTF